MSKESLNDETRNHGERAFGHFYYSGFELVSSFVIRHSSLRSCLFWSIRARASSCRASPEAPGHFIHGNAWITGPTLSPVLRQAKADRCSTARCQCLIQSGKRDEKLAATPRWFLCPLRRLLIQFLKPWMQE